MKFTVVLTMLLTLAVAAPTPEGQHDTLAIAKREPAKGKKDGKVNDAVFTILRTGRNKKKEDELLGYIRR